MKWILYIILSIFLCIILRYIAYYCVVKHQDNNGTTEWKYDQMYEEALKEPYEFLSDYTTLNLDAFKEGYFTSRIRKYPWSNANDVLLETSGLEDGQHLLDAGCGTGLQAIYFCNQYPNLTVSCIVNTENLYNKTCENIKKANLQHRIKAYLMDFDRLTDEIRSQRFDRIFMIQSVGYSVERRKLFRQFKTILKPNGKLFIGTLTVSSKEDHLIKRIISIWKYNFSTIENILSDLEGYTVTTISVEPKWMNFLFLNPSDLYSLYEFNRQNPGLNLDVGFFFTPPLTDRLILASV